MASDEQIREMAYYIWQQEGHPEGKASEHYFRAKQMLEAQESTPPTTGVPAPPQSDTEMSKLSQGSKLKLKTPGRKRSR
jgi:hypothetical protein